MSTDQNLERQLRELHAIVVSSLAFLCLAMTIMALLVSTKHLPSSLGIIVYPVWGITSCLLLLVVFKNPSK